jgi:hypothetical protein
VVREREEEEEEEMVLTFESRGTWYRGAKQP